MKVITVLFLVFLNLELITGYVGIIEYNPKDFTDNNIKDAYCYAKFHSIGEMDRYETKRVLDKCESATCQEDRSILITGCAPVYVMPPCYIAPGNNSKPFPDCCYEVVCPENELSENKLQIFL